MDMSRQQSCNSCRETNGTRQTNNEMTNRCGCGTDFGRNGFFPRPMMGRMNGMYGACGGTQTWGCGGNSPSSGCGCKPMKPCEKERECGCGNTSPSNGCGCRPMKPCEKERECGCGNTSPSNGCGCRPMSNNNNMSYGNNRGCRPMPSYNNNPSANGCGCKPMKPCRKEHECGCGNTSPSNDCSCNKTDCFTKRDDVDDMQIGMAYVPWQEYENVWDGCDGIHHGTIFEDLALPFKCDQCCKR